MTEKPEEKKPHRKDDYECPICGAGLTYREDGPTWTCVECGLSYQDENELRKALGLKPI